MGKTRTRFRQVINQLRLLIGHLLHIAAVTRMQHLTLDAVTNLVTIAFHFRTFAQHFRSDFEILFQNRCRTFFPGQIQRDPPATQREFPADFLSKFNGCIRTVLHTQHGKRRAQTQKTHAVTAFAHDFVTLLFQWQTIDLHHVVEHAGKDGDHLAELFPVERTLLR